MAQRDKFLLHLADSETYECVTRYEIISTPVWRFHALTNQEFKAEIVQMCTSTHLVQLIKMHLSVNSEPWCFAQRTGICRAMEPTNQDQLWEAFNHFMHEQKKYKETNQKRSYHLIRSSAFCQALNGRGFCSESREAAEHQCIYCNAAEQLPLKNDLL